MASGSSNEPKKLRGSASGRDETSCSSSQVGETAAGACCGGGGAGSARPNTVDEFLQMPGASQMFALQPLTWCPHLVEVNPLPVAGLDCAAPCETCGNVGENWVCLVCYTVQCSRYVNEHMMFHKIETDHNMTLSYSDLSVWCYVCDQYVDNRAVLPHKSSAHKSKFGEVLM